MKKTTMNKFIKIITALFIIAMLSTMVVSVFATPTDVLDKVQGDTTQAMSVGGLSSTIKNVIGVVQVICYSAAVIMLILIGVKFITASPEGKAEIKKAAIQYVIGAIIVFAAGTLLGIIANMSTSVVTSA
ncbi:MAG: hypothetical protein HG453_004000 [Clostridiales bacterium]|nr:hypothetical protein [Clostridiales bacterium]